MAYKEQDRRKRRENPTDHQRREADRAEIRDRQEEFRLLRDKILLTIGGAGVIGITLAAVVTGVKDSSLALAALTVFATLLGAPSFLRFDERRRDGSGNGS